MDFLFFQPRPNGALIILSLELLLFEFGDIIIFSYKTLLEKIHTIQIASDFVKSRLL